LRLEQFRTQHELARNFYDDHEFCPIYHIEEVTEHRERIQKRTSPYPSPSHSPPPSYYITLKNQQQQNVQQQQQLHQQQQQQQKQQQQQQNSHRQHRHSQQNHQNSSSLVTRAIPIINPSNMAPVSVPVHQQHPGKINTSPSMAQWVAYKNSTANMTSPTSSNSSISSISSNGSNIAPNYNNNYYLGDNCAINYNQQPHYLPTIARAIPIINPATGQAFGQQQQTPNIPPGFYNVSVC
ncbi:hypothetical protein INT48_002168, partial [Thamnidium elegans]